MIAFRIQFGVLGFLKFTFLKRISNCFFPIFFLFVFAFVFFCKFQICDCPFWKLLVDLLHTDRETPAPDFQPNPLTARPTIRHTLRLLTEWTPRQLGLRFLSLFLHLFTTLKEYNLYLFWFFVKLQILLVMFKLEQLLKQVRMSRRRSELSLSLSLSPSLSLFLSLSVF